MRLTRSLSSTRAAAPEVDYTVDAASVLVT